MIPDPNNPGSMTPRARVTSDQLLEKWRPPIAQQVNTGNSLFLVKYTFDQSATFSLGFISIGLLNYVNVVAYFRFSLNHSDRGSFHSDK